MPKKIYSPLCFFFCFLLLLGLSSCTSQNEKVAAKVEKILGKKLQERDKSLSVKTESVKLDQDSESFVVLISVLKDKEQMGRNQVFVSKDTRFLSFAPILSLNGKSKKSKKAQAVKFPKQKRPEIKLFVMAGCPYGTQAEAIFAPVIEKLSEHVDFQPHYIIYSGYQDQSFCLDTEKKYCSMHGKTEAEEALRQICLWKRQPEKWWQYLERFNKNCNPNDASSKPGACSEEIAESLGIDFEKIKECTQDYAKLLDKELETAKEYQAKGSPTIAINKQLYKGARTPKAIFETICRSFKKQPKVCKEEFNPSIAQSDSLNSNGGCGNK